jgi:hypothetical protein
VGADDAGACRSPGRSPRRRGDDAAFVERDQPGLAADVDLHALRVLGQGRADAGSTSSGRRDRTAAQPLHVGREVPRC